MPLNRKTDKSILEELSFNSDVVSGAELNTTGKINIRVPSKIANPETEEVIKTSNKVIIEKPKKEVTNERKDDQIELSETKCKELDISSAKTLVTTSNTYAKNEKLKKPESAEWWSIRDKYNKALTHKVIEEHKQEVIDIKKEKESPSILTKVVYIYEERNKEQERKHEEKKKQEQKEHKKEKKIEREEKKTKVESTRSILSDRTDKYIVENITNKIIVDKKKTVVIAIQSTTTPETIVTIGTLTSTQKR
ncbi:hypothetical protein Glove_19g393 [Diversispora epigaea]|uniref:Uncharacterized protein n=1 Tax=Diversispora epigaea TaxID=1348612 RepID=A0A397JQD2_9GLOM|nr:hypothetical protein Glove_19g393 [Diversispora epigaea]